jgi:hypothetical protein
MSLCISVVTPEGIVVAGESRQTQVIGGVNRVGSDSATKVFSVSDSVLAACAGWAFLQPQGSTVAKNISSLIEDFKPSIPTGAATQDIAVLLWEHFNTLYREHVAQFPTQAVATGDIAINFIVAGYDPGTSQGTLFHVNIPSTVAPGAPSRSTNLAPGPWWIGQTDVVARIINGYDPRVMNFPFVQAANQNNAALILLNGMSYAVFYGTMTIQDAIDFAVAMIQVTIIIQRFTAGINTQPGAVAGVGGPIDIAVVQPGKEIKWISKKELHA